MIVRGLQVPSYERRLAARAGGRKLHESHVSAGAARVAAAEGVFGR
jgi:hypothetical protein